MKISSSSEKNFFSIIMSTDTFDNTDPHIGRETRLTDLALAANVFLEKYACYRATRPELLGLSRPTSFDTFFPASAVPVLDLLPLLLPNFGTTAHVNETTPRVSLQKLNLLYQVRDNAKYRGVSHDDELLIELVALLFDRIFQDRLLPESIKRQLARLQIPVLRAVFLDRRWFVYPSHPARLLLDRIADTACGRLDMDQADSEFSHLISRVITDIEHKFDKDIACFSKALQQIEDFNQKTWSVETTRHQQAARWLENMERREVNNVQVLMQIRDAITGLELDQGITEFLLVPWRQVLVENQLNGAKPEVLSELQKATVDLVWSLQPKNGSAERQQMVQLLPTLLSAVRRGLQSIDWPVAKQEAFFALLMQLHTSAMHSSSRSKRKKRAFEQFQLRMLGAPEIRTSALHEADFATESVDIPPELLVAGLQQQQLDLVVAQTSPHDKPATPLGLSALEAGDAVAQIDVGTWIELRQQTPPRMLKVHWISPLRTLLLLTDSSGQYVVVFTPEVLRAHLENNTASVLGKLSLTQRVLASIEATMSRNWWAA